VLLRPPRMVVPSEDLVAEEMTGKFCRLFAPVSGSLPSLAVTPPFRSMPSPPLEKMELLRMYCPWRTPRHQLTRCRVRQFRF
jgi:hypothetical protein